jgi:hypothetical protein
MRFYVDEWLPPSVADYLNARRSHRAKHAGRDHSVLSRDAAWHVQEARRRGEGPSHLKRP